MNCSSSLTKIAACLSVAVCSAFAQSPSTVGVWSPVMAWPYEAIHGHLLPTGKVMFWTREDHSQLWDPVSNIVTAAPESGANIFCSGHAFLPDGNLLVAGGHVDSWLGCAVLTPIILLTMLGSDYLT